MVDYSQIITIFASTEEVSGIGALGIDPLAILAQAATFLLLFFIIKKFALTKIVTTLESRRKTIEDGIRLGREMEAEKEQLDEKVKATLKEARIESDKIIADSHEEAGSVIKEAEDVANRKADMMLADAHVKIEEDIDKARVGLEKEMRGLVAEATEAIIKTKLDSKADADLLGKTMKELS
ncbi:MAG TPA: F0F1 ATP synthase subunit B [Candidatus Saccharibacteria bacterium]|nr:F0F1 ATP synthase subunit B [Candidatus Saccharibacteria bacterium]